MDSTSSRLIFGSIVSLMMVVALILAVILGFNLKSKFEEKKLDRDLMQYRIEQELDLKAK